MSISRAQPKYLTQYFIGCCNVPTKNVLGRGMGNQGAEKQTRRGIIYTKDRLKSHMKTYYHINLNMHRYVYILMQKSQLELPHVEEYVFPRIYSSLNKNSNARCKIVPFEWLVKGVSEHTEIKFVLARKFFHCQLTSMVLKGSTYATIGKFINSLHSYQPCELL